MGTRATGAGALQILGTGVDVAVRRVELGTEFLQATHVHVHDRPGTEIIAAGAWPPEASPQRASIGPMTTIEARNCSTIS